MKFTLLTLTLMIWLGWAIVPGLRASEMDKKTIVTFSAPVEIPGAVLSPGQYVIKRADPMHPNILRFFNSDETKVIATINTIPTERQNPSGDVKISTSERRSGQPEALKTWFYPGDLTGQEFVYPKSREVLMASNMISSGRSEEVELTGPVPPPARSETQSRTTEIAQTRPSTTTGSAPSYSAPAQSTTRQPAQSAPASQTANEEQPNQQLPATGSNIPLTAALGSLALCAGAGFRKLARLFA